MQRIIELRKAPRMMYYILKQSPFLECIQCQLLLIITHFRSWLYFHIHMQQKLKNGGSLNPLAYTDVPETAGLARSINP